ncbi:tubulin polyglutamylase TTLL4 isoform X1 [Trematomus bernacchii]|uniref:tubulin polyglutamylase TTLL4 isoform X1 n=1 Tax=Trematomus bernacchii TaxID=40690 RepID=UPI00146C84CA|nr:tubulin polyglutamylase TTLL4 isoform X1 [Trematomus bernacchii]XP_033984617.1 tubulin polyglutamylase TTLL4 isoform X1 [Trematomus bernacchii]
MPTNQSSPWGGAKLRACSTADRPTSTNSVRTHAKTGVATKVPFNQTSLELSRRNDPAKPLSSKVASSASPLRWTTASMVSVLENGNGNVTTHSQFTTVPDGSDNLPQQLHGINNPNQVLDGSSLKDTSATSSFPKNECKIGFNVNSTGITQKCMSLQTYLTVKCLATSRRPAASGDALSRSELLSTACHQDLFIKGQPTLQQTIKMMPETADCSSLPSVPHLCRSLCDQQGAALGDASSTKDTKVEKRSTGETTTMRRSHSAKSKICSETQNSCTITALNKELRVIGGPPATTNCKPKTVVSIDLNKQATDSQCPQERSLSTCGRISPAAASPFPNSPTPTVLSANVRATQEQQPSPPNAITAVASSPSGAMMGSVTSQISAIHLTMQASSPLASSPSPTEECPVGDTEPSGQDCVVQLDGAEEELVDDEMENDCSDDDNSDCSSIPGTSSTASIALLSGIEEPMSLEADDQREERPALVPSLFPQIPPTLYFSTANEKVELLPAEQRRLLKWKISNVTPNIVKHTIGRSHFKATKKSYDWLGCWGHHMKSPGFKALAEHQKLNHFPGTFQIGRKDRLWRNLSKMQVRFGKQEFSFFPRTFVLPQDIKMLRKAWEDGGPRQKWIIKPPASARGIGIQVIHRWGQLPRKRPLLVQKYLHKPYLISGNKFDLRIYVYVSSYDPLRVYIFSDGLVRFASCKYSSSMKTLGNKFMHLTNYSVNKKNSEYQSNSDDQACQGHKWALKALWHFLGSKGVNTTLIWEKIKDIVIKTIIASEPYVNTLLKMHVKTPYSCHELFGFDIMLDEKLKPWILEVNISPSLHSNTALDVSVKGQMIRDLLNLAGFRVPQKDDVITPCSSASSSTTSLCGGNRERTKPDLSADEKVKRAFYLTQRYADQDFLSTVLDVLTPEDVCMLTESEDELSRAGQFQRIFPSQSSSRYLRFFECPRYLNVLLDQWEQKYWNNRTKGISLLSTLCEKGVHLGTNDPAHMWSKSSYISRFETNRQDLIIPSRSRVVVTHQHRSQHIEDDDGSDREASSVSSLPVSSSPGSSVSSSACASPQPGLAHSLLPQHFASL